MGPNIALVVVTNRHNPSGRRFDREILDDVASVVANHSTWLLIDEVYAPFGDRSHDGRAFGGPTTAGLPGVVVRSSLTKFYDLDDLWVGWVIAKVSLVDQLRTTLRYIPVLTEPSVELGRRAIGATSELCSRARSRILVNADQLRSFVEA